MIELFSHEPQGFAAEQVRRTEAAEAPGWEGARRANTWTYLTDEQRPQPGCIGGRMQQLFCGEP